MLRRSVLLLVILATAVHSMISIDEEPVERDGRIMHGVSQANAAVASLRTRTVQGNFHLCGGFIINLNWIGTAAQCVHGREDRAQDFMVGVGTNSITTTRNYDVAFIVPHNDFNIDTLANDIALVRVTAPFTLGRFVAIARINYSFITGTSDVFIFGWGRKRDAGNLSPHLMRGRFRMMQHENCLNDLAATLRSFITQDAQFCSGLAHRSTCPGDAGGPVTLANGEVIGIASRVNPCRAGQTNVNTRISFHQNFIFTYIDF